MTFAMPRLFSITCNSTSDDESIVAKINALPPTNKGKKRRTHSEHVWQYNRQQPEK